jgi:catalase
MEAKMEAKTKLTSAAGIPVGDNQNSLTAGPRSPGLLSAWHLFIVPIMKAEPYTKV